MQIYLPDLKYLDPKLAKRYSAAEDYPQVATAAILRMYDQVGPYEMDDDGILRKGVVIRHLILPGCVDNTKAIIDWVRDHFDDGQVLFSLMRQYVPCGRAGEYPEIDRPLSDEEYDEAEQYLFDSGIEDGFVQEKGSASDAFIPAFDGTGCRRFVVRLAFVVRRNFAQIQDEAIHEIRAGAPHGRPYKNQTFTTNDMIKWIARWQRNFSCCAAPGHADVG